MITCCVRASWLTPIIFAAILANIGFAVRDQVSAQAAKSAIASGWDAVGAGGPPRGGPMLGEASRVRIVRPSRGGYSLSDEAGSNGASVHAHSRSDSASLSSAPVPSMAVGPPPAVASLSAAVGTGAETPWQTTLVTSLATWEPGLDGCGYQGEQHVCETSCNHAGVPWPYRFLHDDKLVAIANPAYGLACGQRVEFLRWDRDHRRFQRSFARVVGVTGALRYGFEFSYRLSRMFGAPDQFGRPLTWSAWISWRPA